MCLPMPQPLLKWQNYTLSITRLRLIPATLSSRWEGEKKKKSVPVLPAHN